MEVDLPKDKTIKRAFTWQYIILAILALSMEAVVWFWISGNIQTIDSSYTSDAVILSTAPTITVPLPIIVSVDPSTPEPTSQAVLPRNPDTISLAIKKVAADNPQIEFGVSYINLNDGARADLNGDKVFTAASTAKVFIACLLLNQVEEGKHSLNDSIDGTKVGSLLQAMINQSNNDAWMSLMSFMGYANQAPYAQKIGITTYEYNENTLSPNDMALLLSKLYSGQLLNREHTQLLLSYMQNTNLETLIPPAVPSNMILYHKYGNLDGLLHDASIIDDGQNPFVLVIFTNSDAGVAYSQRVRVFQDIVKAVLNAT